MNDSANTYSKDLEAQQASGKVVRIVKKYFTGKNTTISALQQRVQTLEAELNSKAGQIRDLESLVNTQAFQLHWQAAKVTAKSEAVHKLKIQVEIQESRLHDQKQEVLKAAQTMQKQLSQRQEKILALELELNSKSKRVNELEKKLQTKEDKLQSTTKQMRDEGKILRTKISSLERKIISLDGYLAYYAGEVQALHIRKLEKKVWKLPNGPAIVENAHEALRQADFSMHHFSRWNIGRNGRKLAVLRDHVGDKDNDTFGIGLFLVLSNPDAWISFDNPDDFFEEEKGKENGKSPWSN